MKPFRALCAALALLLLAIAPAALAGLAPTDDLKLTLDSVIALLAEKKADPVKRKAAVVAKIREDFDFESMSRFILGTNWNEATKVQQQTFVELFTRILEDTYIDRIEAYSDEKVQYLGENRKGERAIVTTKLVGQSKEIPIEYRMWYDRDHWRVYDVSIEGVSLVRNFQDTYRAVIRKEGIDGLLSKMKDKIKEMEAGK